jgi:outer membrane protein assembly factor BamB
MKKLQLLLAYWVIALTVFAQEPPAWKKKFEGNIKWYKITDAGMVVICSGDALYGIKPEDGSELWKLPQFDGIKEDNYDPIEGTPFVAIVTGSAMKRVHTIIDVTDGKIIANSWDLGYRIIQKRINCFKLGSVLFYGMNKDNGKPMLTMIKYNDGSKVWQHAKLFEKNSEQICSEAYVLDDGLLIATNRNIYKLNSATGEIVYSVDMKSDLPVLAASGGGFGSVWGSKGANADATATSADFFQYGDNKIFYFWNQDLITAFTVAEGKPVWKPVEIESPVGLILHDPHGMIVATAEKSAKDIEKASKKKGGLGGLIGGSGNKNRAQLLCLDYATGALKWNDEVDLQGDIVSYKLNGKKLILATARDQGTNYISIVDLDAGKSITKKALKIDGMAADLQIVPQGLYYRTAKVENCIGVNASDKTGYVYGNHNIYKVNFETGDMAEWVTNIQLEGKEEPTDMEIHNGAVLLTAPQNMNKYDMSGKILFHTYTKAPGRSTGGKIFSAFGGVLAAAGAMASAANAASLSYAKGYYGSTDPQLDRDIKNANNMTSAFGGAAISSFKSISRRFTASRQADDFMAMLTNLDGGNGKDNVGIVCISKIDGKPGKKVVFGDKTPDYKLDQIDRMIYFKNADNEMEGFRF